MNTRTFPPLLALALIAATSAVGVADDATAVAVSANATAAESYLLRFQFEPGQTLRYQSSQTTNQQATTTKATKTDISKVEQRRLFTVGEMDEDGAAEIAMQFEHVRMQVGSNGQAPVGFDSTMKPNKVPAQFRGTAAQLKRVASRFQVQPKGTPVSDEGVEQIAKGGQASFLIPLPTKPVAVGESWNVYMPVQVRLAEKVMREITLLRSYRLKSVDDGVAKIVFFTSIESPVKSPFVKGQLVQATPSGIILFDIANGQVLRKEIKIDKSVLGAMGASTILSVTSHTVERLLTEEETADPKVTAR